MARLPEAWSPGEAQWVRLAPGVKWLLKRPDGAIRAVVAADVGTLMAKVYAGRAALDAMGLDLEVEGALDLDRIAGLASVFSACLYARHCLQGWEGIDDPATATPLDHSDPDNVRAALIYGPPPEGQPLLAPFLAWVEGPRRPMAAEAVRLKALARDHWSGGAERCRACDDEGDACAKGGSVDGELCPRLANAPQTPEGLTAWAVASGTSGPWARAGMSGALTGLDYRAALLAVEAVGEVSDMGAVFKALQAIEAGRLEAEADRAEAKA